MNRVVIEGEDGCQRVKYGPLVVDPRPNFATDDEYKQYVATYDDNGPPDVCVSHITPFWVLATLSVTWDIVSYYKRGEQVFSRGRTAGNLFSGTTYDSYPVVDGNGYLYYVTSNWGTPLQDESPGRPWEFRIRRFTPSNDVDDLILDVRSLVPAVNAFGNPIVDGIAWIEPNASSRSRTTDAASQNDGIVLFCLIHELPANQSITPWPTTTAQYLAIYLTKDLVVDHTEWLPVSDGVSHEPLWIINVLRPPLPNGYLTSLSDGFDDILHKCIGGSVANSVSLAGSAFFASAVVWFHDDGSFWLVDQGRIRHLSASLVDITPAWVEAINDSYAEQSILSLYFFVTSSPPSDLGGHFRFITIEMDSLDAPQGAGGHGWYRVRDRTGAIVLEKERDDDFYADGRWFERMRYPGLLVTNALGVNYTYLSATHAKMLAQCTNDQFLVLLKIRESSFTQYGAHKMSADSIVASPSLSPLTFDPAIPNLIFPRGQWPQLDYSNWSVA